MKYISFLYLTYEKFIKPLFHHEQLSMSLQVQNKQIQYFGPAETIPKMDVPKMTGLSRARIPAWAAYVHVTTSLLVQTM